MLERITDCNAIKDNIMAARMLLPQYCKLMLIVKANAYGCGVAVARIVEHYVDYYGVARVSEGVELRRSGITSPILVLSSYRGEYSEAVGKDIAVSVSCDDDLLAAVRLNLPIHIAVDSGMNRYGYKLESYDELAMRCKAINADIRGVFSHIYHNSGQVISAQRQTFDRAQCAIKAVFPSALVHIASSGSMAASNMSYDMVRLGINGYDNATYIVSRILLVKEVMQQETVSYGGLWVANNQSKIVIIEGGYADGVPKSISGQSIIVAGMAAQVIGAVCMDCIIADVTGIDCNVGDTVVLCGGDRSTRELANSIKLTEYELLTGLKGRYNYVYFN